jgi:hypothetical protein
MDTTCHAHKRRERLLQISSNFKPCWEFPLFNVRWIHTRLLPHRPKPITKPQDREFDKVCKENAQNTASHHVYHHCRGEGDLHVQNLTLKNRKATIFSARSSPRRPSSSDRINPFRSIPWIFAGVAAVCLALRALTIWVIPPTGYLTPHLTNPTHARIDALFFGVFLGYLYHFRTEASKKFLGSSSNRVLIGLFSALLLSTCYFFDRDGYFLLSFGLTFIYLGFGGLLVLSLEMRNLLKGRVARITGHIGTGCAFIGRHSYSIYLWHAPLIEIGLAYGYSTIYILAALKANGRGHHVAIDPFQVSSWCGVGITRQEVLGLHDLFEFSPETSAQAFAQFAKEGRIFDAIFIDGDHKFDSVLLDFSLSASVCAPGGHIILDDMWMPSVKCAASFIRSNRKDFSELPSSIPSLAIFKKTGTDNRAWDDFAPF